MESRKLSKSQLARLKRQGARILDDSAPKQKEDNEIVAIKESVATINARVDTVEKIVQSFSESAATQTEQLKELINRIPTQEGLPPITGFTFVRDQDGIATAIVFDREPKRMVN